VSDGFALQVSLKTRGIQNKDWASMVNIRGGSVEELDRYLDTLLEGDTFSKIDKLERTLAAVDVIQTAFQAEASAKASSPAQQPGVVTHAAPQQAPAAAQGQAPAWFVAPRNANRYQLPGEPSPSGEPSPICIDGVPMYWKEFTSQQGKNLKGWFCSKDNRNCKAIFKFDR